MDESISREKEKSIYVQSGIFGDSAEECVEALTAFREFISKIEGSWL
jgi:hypothetical protein